MSEKVTKIWRNLINVKTKMEISSNLWACSECINFNVYFQHKTWLTYKPYYWICWIFIIFLACPHFYLNIYKLASTVIIIFALIKFGLYEKHTKFEKIFLISKCTKHEEDWENFCILLSKSELYLAKSWVCTHSSATPLGNVHKGRPILG